jgi:glycerol-3-phosphate acyltransferase PlsY
MQYLPLQIIISCFIGYLLGTSNMAYYIAKIKKIDLRSSGSGNLGASNAVIMLGKKAGILTFIHDAGKTVLSVFLVGLLFPDSEFLHILAGIASIYGHIFPFYLKFKGGKGFASYMGLLLAIDWRLFLITFVYAVLITIITDYIVFGTMSVTILTPIIAYFLTNNIIASAIMYLATAIIIWKHRENFVKIKNKTEIGFQEAVFKKKRKK